MSFLVSAGPGWSCRLDPLFDRKCIFPILDREPGWGKKSSSDLTIKIGLRMLPLVLVRGFVSWCTRCLHRRSSTALSHLKLHALYWAVRRWHLSRMWVFYSRIGKKNRGILEWLLKVHWFLSEISIWYSVFLRTRLRFLRFFKICFGKWKNILFFLFKKFFRKFGEVEKVVNRQKIPNSPKDFRLTSLIFS